MVLLINSKKGKPESFFLFIEILEKTYHLCITLLFPLDCKKNNKDVFLVNQLRINLEINNGLNSNLNDYFLDFS